jgi:hypothetical protein
MTKYILTLIVISCTLLTSAFGEQLGDATYLRKISLHVRGIKPTAEEYQELSQLKDSKEKELFFRKKIKDYLKTKNHEDRMVFRLAELFKLKTPAFFDESQKMYSPDISTTKESLTELFAEIARENLSWDTLLNGKRYTAYPKQANSFSQGDSSDVGFFKLAYESLPETWEGVISSPILAPISQIKDPIEIEFSKDDPRVAGALTTRRFLSRYTTTALNKNRRRAAAVFRIFLCDSMIPAIDSNKDRKHEFLDAAFADKFEVTEDMIATQLSDDSRHGADPQCMSCHSKLDPLGKTFQASGVILHPESFAGRLFYKRSNTDFVDVPARGIGDIAEAIVKQPEYEDCQVKWFWDQFIGINVPLSATKSKQLVQKFNRLNRKTNDFIEYLVSLPEFRNKPSVNNVIMFSQVKNLLKRCDSCHSYEGFIPSFSSLPIGFTRKSEEQTKWLQEIKKRLLLPKGHKDAMPKDREKNWSESDINTLILWLSTGAKNDEGQSMLSGDQ